MNRMKKALGAFALTLTLVLSLAMFPFCTAGAEEIHSNYAGYLVMLDTQAAAAPAGLAGQATLMAAYDERLGLLPLVEDLGIYKAGRLEDIQNLVWSGQVLVAEPDYEVQLFDLEYDHTDPTKPDDPFFIATNHDYQFNLRGSDKHGINVQAAWDAGLTGEGVTVAVIDSGINLDHEDAPAKIARGRYYYYKEEANGPYQFAGDPKHYNYYSSDDVTDDRGHGTMVSGIIAAQKDNGKGIAGIAPNVTIIPIKCFTNQPGHLGGYISNLVSGVKYAMDNGANIINMSWGLLDNSAVLHTTITQAANSGCILLAAVGNSKSSTLQYPAAWDEVIGVGSTDRDGYLSDFSQRNSSVAVCAPGGKNGANQIWSLNFNGSSAIGKGDGTSFATPMVAASAALLKEAHPTMTQADFLTLLEGNCDEVLVTNENDRAYTGLGVINLRKLLDAAGASGTLLYRNGDSVTLRSAYHPIQSAAAPADNNAVLMIGAYNAKGHLLDSKIAAPSLGATYGAYTLSATFNDPNVATLRAYYLKNNTSLVCAAPPDEVAVR